MIVDEPGGIDGDWDQLQTISRGIANFSIDAHGQQGHRVVGCQAVRGATQECAGCSSASPKLFEPSFTPSMPGLRPTVNAGVRIEGGVGFGVVPGKASFAVDVARCREWNAGSWRPISSASSTRPVSNTGLRADYRFEPPPRDWLPATEVAADALIVEARGRARGRARDGAAERSVPGTTDAAGWQGLGRHPAGLGPGLLERFHTADERVVHALRQAVDAYRARWRDFSGQPTASEGR